MARKKQKKEARKKVEKAREGPKDVHSSECLEDVIEWNRSKIGMHARLLHVRFGAHEQRSLIMIHAEFGKFLRLEFSTINGKVVCRHLQDTWNRATMKEKSAGSEHDHLLIALEILKPFIGSSLLETFEWEIENDELTKAIRKIVPDSTIRSKKCLISGPGGAGITDVHDKSCLEKCTTLSVLVCDTYNIIPKCTATKYVPSDGSFSTGHVQMWLLPMDENHFNSQLKDAEKTDHLWVFADRDSTWFRMKFEEAETKATVIKVNEKVTCHRIETPKLVVRFNKSPCGYWAEAMTGEVERRHSDEIAKRVCGLGFFCKKCTDPFEFEYFRDVPIRIGREKEWDMVFLKNEHFSRCSATMHTNVAKQLASRNTISPPKANDQTSSSDGDTSEDDPEAMYQTKLVKESAQRLIGIMQEGRRLAASIPPGGDEMIAKQAIEAMTRKACHDCFERDKIAIEAEREQMKADKIRRKMERKRARKAKAEAAKDETEEYEVWSGDLFEWADLKSLVEVQRIRFGVQEHRSLLMIHTGVGKFLRFEFFNDAEKVFITKLHDTWDLETMDAVLTTEKRSHIFSAFSLLSHLVRTGGTVTNVFECEVYNESLAAELASFRPACVVRAKKVVFIKSKWDNLMFLFDPAFLEDEEVSVVKLDDVENLVPRRTIKTFGCDFTLTLKLGSDDDLTDCWCPSTSNGSIAMRQCGYDPMLYKKLYESLESCATEMKLDGNCVCRRIVRNGVVLRCNKSPCGYWLDVVSADMEDQFRTLIDAMDRQSKWCRMGYCCKKCTDPFEYEYFKELPQRWFKDPDWKLIFERESDQQPTDVQEKVQKPVESEEEKIDRSEAEEEQWRVLIREAVETLIPEKQVEAARLAGVGRLPIAEFLRATLNDIRKNGGDAAKFREYLKGMAAGKEGVLSAFEPPPPAPEPTLPPPEPTSVASTPTPFPGAAPRALKYSEKQLLDWIRESLKVTPSEEGLVRVRKLEFEANTDQSQLCIRTGNEKFVLMQFSPKNGKTIVSRSIDTMDSLKSIEKIVDRADHLYVATLVFKTLFGCDNAILEQLKIDLDSEKLVKSVEEQIRDTKFRAKTVILEGEAEEMKIEVMWDVPEDVKTPLTASEESISSEVTVAPKIAKTDVLEDPSAALSDKQEDKPKDGVLVETFQKVRGAVRVWLIDRKLLPILFQLFLISLVFTSFSYPVLNILFAIFTSLAMVYSFFELL